MADADPPVIALYAWAALQRSRDDHAAYLGHWLTILKEDTRAIFSAATHAQRAADFLNSLQPQQQHAAA